jgi:hypothetical protein
MTEFRPMDCHGTIIECHKQVKYRRNELHVLRARLYVKPTYEALRRKGLAKYLLEEQDSNLTKVSAGPSEPEDGRDDIFIQLRRDEAAPVPRTVPEDEVVERGCVVVPISVKSAALVKKKKTLRRS